MALSNFYLSDRGNALMAQTLTGRKINITRAQIGEGFWPDGTTYANIAALAVPLKDLTIAKKRADISGQTIITVQFSTSGIGRAFNWSEFALWAADPENPSDRTEDFILGASRAINAGETVRFDSNLEEFNFNVILKTTSAEAVEIIVNESLVYATLDEDGKLCIEQLPTHAATHAADGEDPLTPEMLGATSSAIATIEGDVSLLDGANTPGHYLFLDRNGYFGTGGGLFDVYVSKQSYDDRTSMTQTAKRTYPTNDGIDWVRYFYDVGGWTEWRQFRTADKVMVTGNILDIDNISNDGIYNVMPTATGTFPAVLDEQPETVRKVGVLMHKIWDGNYVEQTFFSYASAKVYRRAMRNGLWAGWENMLTSGGDSTIDGSLSVNFGSGTLLSWLIENETATAMAAFRNDKVGRVHVVVYDDKSDAYLSFFDGQNWASYQMLHTGNAPAVIATAELV